MERALARWPRLQLLGRTGAPTRESPHLLGAEGPLDVCWGGADRCPQVDSGMRWRVSCFEDIVALRDVLVCGPGAAGAREALLRARAAGGCAPESWTTSRCYAAAKVLADHLPLMISLFFLGNGDKKSSLPGLFQASRKACLHLLSSFLTSNFLFNPLLPDLFCSVERPYLRPLVLSHWVLATACPWEAWALPCPRPHGRCGGYQLGPLLLHLFVSLLISTTRLLPLKTMQQVRPVPGTPAGPAEDPDGRGRNSPPRTPFCPREPAELLAASPVPLHFHPFWAEDPTRNPPRKERPSRATQHPPTFKSLRSHRDTLHTFPRDRPDPKTLDQGRPLRGGASPPGLSLGSHPSSD
ncbi:uncharacterized protein LOC122894088 [Neovison vison]|uniref:uncharacterized protein LOC122894088 n=1 Tax=Neovison vison TaxID=452646 RepID=UPI001CF091D8|nr:uncharacterized protein LOC122894088 [Neogale vison]